MAGFFDGLFSGGEYEKELQDLKKKAAHDPNNFHLLVRIGDLLEKIGKRAEALEVYRKASKKYAQKGFLVQAIAVNKVVLRLDPTQSKIHDQLADLYAKREMVREETLERERSNLVAEEEAAPVIPPIPLFCDLKKDELSRVIEKIQAKQYSRGAFICQEGDPGDSIFIISRGKVEIFRQPAGGERISLNVLQEGDFFGEFAFFSNSRRQATVEPLEDTEILEIKKKDLQEIIEEFPSVSDVLLKFYKDRVLDNLLVTSTLFQSFTPQERKNLLDKFTLKEFPAEATVLEEGSPGDSLYIIKKGEVEVFTTDAQGATLVLARLQEGDFFGEISLLTGKPRTASVKVLQPVELMRLAKNDFDQIIHNHLEVLKILEDSLQLRLEGKLRALGVFRENPAKEGMV